ncbi:hypothetical protein SteCoe_7512 [Stentor coeruleus]|uniref:Uncharacterized protein n=1 Tax=Stentor coeruleus TaxID=5963 RepID=A0A1R2CML7_9CILI|nr:hypothetical protein SteCoe_7512 [Stentor coeruleus]
MGCCESNKASENEVIVGEKLRRESDFYDVSLESPGIISSFDMENLHTSKSIYLTTRSDTIFLHTSFINNISN